jgi:hypothetical protein
VRISFEYLLEVGKSTLPSSFLMLGTPNIQMAQKAQKAQMASQKGKG